MPQDQSSARRGRRRAQSEPLTPWQIVVGELKLAGIVATSVVVVVLARRWITAVLGTDMLSAEILSGGVVVSDLIDRVEPRVFQETHARPPRPRSGPATDSSK